MPEESGYLFDNSSTTEAAQRFNSLEILEDQRTINHIVSLDIKEESRCLEIRGGNGSIARWLAGKVGRSGEVVATDLDTRFLERSLADLANVRVVRHDIGKDEVEQGHYDLVHARHVLVHVPKRQRAVTRIVSSLKRGGWILVEDFDGFLLKDHAVGDRDSIEIYNRFSNARHQVILKHGMDLEWGRKLVPLFLSHGLVDIGIEAYSTIWRGMSPGAQIEKANFVKMRDEIIKMELMTEEEIDEGLKIFDDPNWGRIAPLLIGAWGRKS